MIQVCISTKFNVKSQNGFDSSKIKLVQIKLNRIVFDEEVFWFGKSFSIEEGQDSDKFWA